MSTLLLAVGGLVALVCGLASFIYSVKILILNFQENVLWGLASLFFGLPGLIFVIMRWDKAGRPFLMSIATSIGAAFGGVIMGVGMAMG